MHVTRVADVTFGSFDEIYFSQNYSVTLKILFLSVDAQGVASLNFPHYLTFTEVKTRDYHKRVGQISRNSRSV